jgi:hypothetical protein
MFKIYRNVGIYLAAPVGKSPAASRAASFYSEETVIVIG